MSTVSWRLPTRRSRAWVRAVADRPPRAPARRPPRPRAVAPAALPPAVLPVAAAAAAGVRAAPARAPIRHLTWSATVPASRSPRWRRPWGSSRTTCTACCPASPKTARSSSPAAVGIFASRAPLLLSDALQYFGSDQTEAGDGVTLADELFHGLVDPRLGELRHVETLDDLPFTVGRLHRERGDDPLGDSIGAIARHRHRDPVTVAGPVHPVVHVIDRGAGGAGGG